jgi:hypothetical protein
MFKQVIEWAEQGDLLGMTRFVCHAIHKSASGPLYLSGLK